MAIIKAYIEQQHSTSSFAHCLGSSVVFLSSSPSKKKMAAIGGHKMVLAVSV
jgi:hypothetical protein